MHLETAKPLRVVSIFDEALDRDAMGPEALARYGVRRDPALLKLLPGAQPAWFTIHRPTTTMFGAYIVGGGPESRMHERAFEIGCSLVENLEDVDGCRVARLEPSKQKIGDRSISFWSDDEKNRVPWFIVDEIGGCIAAMGFCKAGSGRVFPLPQWSERVLELQSLLLAEGRLTTQVAANSAPRPAQPETAPSDSGAEPTAATAQESLGPPE